MHFSDERLAAIQKWAQRIVAHPEEGLRRERKEPRKHVDVGVLLLPLDMESLRPIPEMSARVISKDESKEGLGVISNIRLEADLYFGDRGAEAPIYLLGKVWELEKPAGTVEYGFQILDRYDSFEEFRAIY